MTGLVLRRSLLVAATVAFGTALATPSKALTGQEAGLWIDAVLDAAKRAGARDAKRGPVVYDAVSGRLDVGEISFVVGPATTPLTITIGSLAGTGVADGPNGGLRADRLTLQQIKLSGGDGSASGSMDVPALVVSGLETPGVTREAIGRDGFAAFLPALQGLVAREMTIARLTGNARLPEIDALSFSYADWRIEALGRGLMRRLSVGETEFRMTTKEIKDLHGRFGRMAVEDIDFGVYADLSGVAPVVSKPGDIKTLYARGDLDGGTLNVGGTAVRIGPIAIRGVKVKVPRVGALGLLATIQAYEARDKAARGNTPELAAFSRDIKDWLDVVTTDAMEVNGVSVETGMGTVRLSRIALERYGMLDIGKIALNGLLIETPELKARADLFSIGDFSMSAFYRELLERLAAGDNLYDFTAFAGKLPRIGTIDLAGAELTPPGMPMIALGRFGFEMGNWRGFIVDRLRVALDRLVVPSAALETVGPPTPADLGYGAVDLSGEVALSYDEAAKRLSLSTARVAMPEGVRAATEATIGGLDTGLLMGIMGRGSGSPEDLTFERFAFRFENLGLLERALAWIAARQGTTPEALKTQFTAVASAAAEAIPDDALKADIRAAIAAFAKSLKGIAIAVEAKERVGLMELQAVTPPSLAALLSRLKISVEGN